MSEKSLLNSLCSQTLDTKRGVAHVHQFKRKSWISRYKLFLNYCHVTIKTENNLNCVTNFHSRRKEKKLMINKELEFIQIAFKTNSTRIIGECYKFENIFQMFCDSWNLKKHYDFRFLHNFYELNICWIFAWYMIQANPVLESRWYLKRLQKIFVPT